MVSDENVSSDSSDARIRATPDVAVMWKKRRVGW